MSFMNIFGTSLFLRPGVLAPRPTPKLDDHPLSVVRDCLFNIFAAPLRTWRASPPSATCFNIKMDLRERGWYGMDWIDLAQDMDQWRALMNTVMYLRVP
jgi:hypothetical protein